MIKTVFRLFFLGLALATAGCESTITGNRDEIKTRLAQASGDTVFVYQSNIRNDNAAVNFSHGGGNYTVVINNRTVGVIGDQQMLTFTIPRGQVEMRLNVLDMDGIFQKPIREVIENKGQGPYYYRVLVESNGFVEYAGLARVTKAEFEELATRPVRF